MNLACIVGARPNFMKIAPLLCAFEAFPVLQPTLIHTGQHYDSNLSDVFFEELGISRPDIALNIGSGSHGQQTAEILVAIENVLVDAEKSGAAFDRMIVVGDVNSTMAASIAAAKLLVPVAHVEAGLRSFDRTMPEEINRMLTDSISDMLLASEPAGIENLKREGHPDSRMHLVGNVMINTLLNQVERARQSDILERLKLQPRQYGVVTLHRPANVDDRKVLASLIDVMIEISAKLPLVFPVHPRTKTRLESFGLDDHLASCQRLICLEPQGYNDFLCLTSQAKVIVTDSGGLQEESTALGVPCLTMRPNTERPITVTLGTSTLIGSDAAKLKMHLEEVITDTYKQGKCPDLWDGKAAERIAQILVNEAHGTT